MFKAQVTLLGTASVTCFWEWSEPWYGENHEGRLEVQRGPEWTTANSKRKSKLTKVFESYIQSLEQLKFFFSKILDLTAKGHEATWPPSVNITISKIHLPSSRRMALAKRGNRSLSCQRTWKRPALSESAEDLAWIPYKQHKDMASRGLGGGGLKPWGKAKMGWL